MLFSFRKIPFAYKYADPLGKSLKNDPLLSKLSSIFCSGLFQDLKFLKDWDTKTIAQETDNLLYSKKN